MRNFLDINPKGGLLINPKGGLLINPKGRLMKTHVSNNIIKINYNLQGSYNNLQGSYNNLQGSTTIFRGLTTIANRGFLLLTSDTVHATFF